MILSVWRYSHFFLACISAFFLLSASLSGIILSFSSIEKENNLSHYTNLDDLSLSDLCDSLNSKYLETLSIEMKDDGIEAYVITNDGDSKRIYVDPLSASEISKPLEEAEIYKLTRIFHRSLFFKKTGRILVGLSSLVLFLIAVSGLLLLIRRQGSFLAIFKKLSKDSFYAHWHVQLSRIFILAIVIIALTGVYLSMERFDLAPGKQQAVHQFDLEQVKETPVIQPSNFSCFKDTKLSDLELLSYPFSPFPEDGDHFQLRTHSSDRIINQFTGEVLSEFEFGIQKDVSEWSYILHTGKGSISWSIVLCITSCSILFFMFTGFQVSWKRLKHRKTNRYKRSKSEYIILVGSENGNTMRFAKYIYKLLIANNKIVYIDHLNNYKPAKRRYKLLVMTSTYGQGEAPSGADQFLKKLNKGFEDLRFEYSVLGFGSRNYPEFCKFAEDINQKLLSFEHLYCNTPIHLVNQQSDEEFNNWKELWIKNNGLRDLDHIEDEGMQYGNFKVIDFTRASDHPRATFMLTLQNEQNQPFESGDLLAIRPLSDNEERMYSIGKGSSGDVVLYIKRHPQGVCSQFLSEQSKGSMLEARIISNSKFHVPKRFKSLILISNGTGIAPFMGMINENMHKGDIDLFWGGASKEDYSLYKNSLYQMQKEGKISTINTVFSEGEKSYVQDLILNNKSMIVDKFQAGSSVMICGSLKMESSVCSVFEEIFQENGLRNINYYKSTGRIKTDCY